jgi:predicted DNA-binding transcriptional regulator YafY
MTQRSASSHLQRLEQLKGLLKARESTTAAELADELGVSVRSLNRDLAILRDAGVPIESERGRGGGVRLQRNWSLGRLHLTPEETLDLLLALAIAERMHSPLLLKHLAPLKRKIAAAFPVGQEKKVRALRQRLFIGPYASRDVLVSFAPPSRKALTGLAEAFFDMRCLTITYVDQKNATTRRLIEPHFLFLSAPVWYLLAWDRLRKAVRCFRVDRIRSMALSDEVFRLGDAKVFLCEAEAIAGNP